MEVRISLGAAPHRIPETKDITVIAEKGSARAVELIYSGVKAMLKEIGIEETVDRGLIEKRMQDWVAGSSPVAQGFGIDIPHNGTHGSYEIDVQVVDERIQRESVKEGKERVTRDLMHKWHDHL